MTKWQGGPGSQECLHDALCSIGCLGKGFCSVSGSLREEALCCTWKAPFCVGVCLREVAVGYTAFYFNK